MGAGCMRGLNNPFPAPGAGNVHRWFGLGPPSLLLREAEAPWKKATGYTKHDGISKIKATIGKEAKARKWDMPLRWVYFLLLHVLDSIVCEQIPLKISMCRCRYVSIVHQKGVSIWKSPAPGLSFKCLVAWDWIYSLLGAWQIQLLSRYT